MKICSCCKKHKIPEDFELTYKNVGSRRSVCKECRLEQARARTGRKPRENPYVRKGFKKCSQCKAYKTIESFFNLGRSDNKVRSECKQCSRKISGKKERFNPYTETGKVCSVCKKHKSGDYFYKAGNKLRSECIDCCFFARIKSVYKITRLEYENLLKRQKGLCPVCNKSLLLSKPHVDHDHVTGAVRGITCAQCNWAIGYFRENKTYIREAITYLNHGKNNLNQYYKDINKIDKELLPALRSTIKYKYSMNEQQYLKIMMKSFCDICKENFGDVARNKHIDHCHSTGTVRGLLCRLCNIALGKARDNTNILNQMILYLGGN